MKNIKFRINADFIISILGMIILLAVGLSCLFGCILAIIKGGNGWIPESDGDFERAFEFITVPVSIALHIFILSAFVTIGFIPVNLGLMIGALGTVSRFAHTESCTVITKSYTKLMTAANVLTCTIFGSCALCVITLLLKDALNC